MGISAEAKRVAEANEKSAEEREKEAHFATHELICPRCAGPLRDRSWKTIFRNSSRRAECPTCKLAWEWPVLRAIW